MTWIGTCIAYTGNWFPLCNSGDEQNAAHSYAGSSGPLQSRSQGAFVYGLSFSKGCSTPMTQPTIKPPPGAGPLTVHRGVHPSSRESYRFWLGGRRRNALHRGATAKMDVRFSPCRADRDGRSVRRRERTRQARPHRDARTRELDSFPTHGGC
jgi:hypothetical protein